MPVFFIIFVFHHMASATSAVTGTSVSTREPKAFGLTTAVSRSNSLVRMNDVTVSSSMEIYLGPQFLAESFSFSGKIYYVEDLRRIDQSDWTDLSLSMTPKKSWATGVIGFTPSVVALIPVSRDARLRQELNGGLGLSLNAKINSQNLALQGVSLGFMLSAMRYFHPFMTAVDGSVNTEWATRQGMYWRYTKSKWSLSLNLVNRLSISSFGSEKNFYDNSQEVSYQLSPSVAIDLSHSLSDLAQKSNGESNFNLMNDNRSTVSLGLSIQI